MYIQSYVFKKVKTAYNFYWRGVLHIENHTRVFNHGLQLVEHEDALLKTACHWHHLLIVRCAIRWDLRCHTPTHIFYLPLLAVGVRRGEMHMVLGLPWSGHKCDSSDCVVTPYLPSYPPTAPSCRLPLLKLTVYLISPLSSQAIISSQARSLFVFGSPIELVTSQPSLSLFTFPLLLFRTIILWGRSLAMAPAAARADRSALLARLT